MDHASVEGALSGEPALSGSFAWNDDSSLTFTPDSAFLPGTSLAISIADSAKSAKGMAMLRPVSLSYTTGDYLRLAQSLPVDHAADVDPTGAVMVTFNQPVVALGADPSNLPAAFTLTPAAQGQGEWINTSTYIFYPQPALSGGVSYQASLNSDLTSTAGAPLESASSWSFTTVMPRLVSTEPIDGISNVRLDAAVKLNFSYSMDSASVGANFSLQNKAGDAVSGSTGWNDDFTTFVFTPTSLLARDTAYTVLLGAEASALGGTPLGEPQRLVWYTVPELGIFDTDPGEDRTKPTYNSVKLYLSSLVKTENIKDFVSFEPSVPNLDGWMDPEQLVLNLWGNFDPDTSYTLKVLPDLTDLWGSRLGITYTLHFHTSALDPAIQFPYTGDPTFLTTSDTGILAQVTNLSSIPLSIGKLSMDDLVQMYGDNGYQFRQDFVPADVEYWTYYPEVPRNRATTVNIPLAPDGRPRSPGLYFMRFNVPNTYGYTQSAVLAVSHYQATLKLTPNEAFVWAVDLKTNQPAANLPVSVYDQSGTNLAAGTTDVSGIFQSPITAQQDPYNLSFAVLGTPGGADAGFVFSNWNEGVSSWDFDIYNDYYPNKLMAYVYTDRPIYRPGDTVYFRVVVREVSNGRYSLPDIGSYELQLNDYFGLRHRPRRIPLAF
jgi:hypothetical protein